MIINDAFVVLLCFLCGLAIYAIVSREMWVPTWINKEIRNAFYRVPLPFILLIAACGGQAYDESVELTRGIIRSSHVRNMSAVYDVFDTTDPQIKKGGVTYVEGLVDYLDAMYPNGFRAEDAGVGYSAGQPVMQRLKITTDSGKHPVALGFRYIANRWRVSYYIVLDSIDASPPETTMDTLSN